MQLRERVQLEPLRRRPKSACVEAVSMRRDSLNVGLLFRLRARADTEDDVARFLENDLAGALEGLPTSAWAALRFDLLQFGVAVGFSERDGQESDVGERVAKTLRDSLRGLLDATPSV